MTINNLLHAILTASKPDIASMTVYDAMTLTVKQDNQLRQLANYLIDNGRLSFDVSTAAAEQIFVGDTLVATTALSGTNLLITFETRLPMLAQSLGSDDTILQNTIAGKVITVTNATTYSTIKLTII
jgi:hypothetical protein